ncbi:proline iminopeptidase [Panaeolus papilionaceus]|nr:proline iminopeptidase [Panaeolus papilionaceus]
MRDGTLPFVYNNETYHIYFKILGNLKTQVSTPLIVLHGGPGLIHNYLFPFEDLAHEGIPIIFYDQIGNGQSTHLPHKPREFWTIDLFVSELDNIITGLGIQERFDLLGHSWGGILAAEYEVRRQPPGLQHLILSNTPASAALRNKSIGQLLLRFPQDVQDALMSPSIDPPVYHAAIKAFHAKHGCVVRPVPDEYFGALDAIFGPDGDPTVLNAQIVRNDWTIIGRLNHIRVPTLIINGREDFMQDFVVAPLAEVIKGAKWVRFENSSHTPFYEEKDKYMNLIRGFVQEG